MPTTWIDVASDAVKIGLGGLIAGLMALIGSSILHRQRLSEEFSRRKRDSLENIATEFDRIASLGADRVTRWILLEAAERMDTAESLELATALAKELTAEMPVSKCCDKLESIELRLTLLALPKAARAVGEYRERFREVDLPSGDAEQRQARRGTVATELSARRVIVISELSKIYAR